MPGTEMATYEDDDTRLDFDVESDLSRFLSSVLQRTDQISQSKVDDKIVKQHIIYCCCRSNGMFASYAPRQQFEY